ncbi:unnamed protein product [Dicrocoelium dendriticum]|nr:unnamed protein product [Dicrocoelium dendriticum]
MSADTGDCNVCRHGKINRYNKSNIIAKLLQNGALFLESISIRGCSRIVRAPNMFIRLLWICFLVSTTIFLIISVRRIVMEYLSYSLNIETEEQMDAPAAFPAVTFCNHQPFSERAYQLWRSESVLSPSQFNRLLRDRAFKLINESRLRNHPFPINQVAYLSIVFDTIKLYYQNLNWPQHKLLGHQRNETIYLCLLRLSGEHLVLGGPGCYDPMVHITERSHPYFFNCYTVNIDAEYSKDVSELGLIIWLGPPENFDVQFRQAFLLDMFEQAHGLRVALHEPGHLVNLERLGMQIEPGRMNEINFEVIHKKLTSTPRKPCVQNAKQIYSDLDLDYDYQFEICLEANLQNIIMQECSCLYAYLPRISFPNAEIPYCGRLIYEGVLDDVALSRKMQCVQKVVKRFATLRKEFEAKKLCLHRCESVEYDSRLSVTTWRTTYWQLYWSQETAVALEQIDPQMPYPNDPSLEKLLSYFQNSNLSDVPVYPGVQSNVISSKYGFSDRHTYLLIKRKRNDTLIRKEGLVLTLDALVSRIGGLCSLYIGMTFAIFIEIIEFFYLVYVRNFGDNPNANLNSRNENQSQAISKAECCNMPHHTELPNKRKRHNGTTSVSSVYTQVENNAIGLT